MNQGHKQRRERRFSIPLLAIVTTLEEIQITELKGLQFKPHVHWLESLAGNLDNEEPTGLWGWLSLKSHAHCSFYQVPQKSPGPFSSFANLSPLPGGHQSCSNLGFILPTHWYFLLMPAIFWPLSWLRQKPSPLSMRLLPFPAWAGINHASHLLNSIEVPSLCSEFYIHGII